MIDLHSHLLPGLDDGAVDVEEAVAISAAPPQPTGSRRSPRPRTSATTIRRPLWRWNRPFAQVYLGGRRDRARASGGSTPALGLREGWFAGDLRLLVGALAGSPQPRPRFVATARTICSDYLLHHARFEGLDLSDPRPMAGAIAFALRTLVARSQT
jgi:hypothetical protein